MLFGDYAEVIYANGTSRAGTPGEPLSLEDDGFAWLHRDGLKWPHFAVG